MDLFFTDSSGKIIPIIYVIDDDDNDDGFSIGIGVSVTNNQHGMNNFLLFLSCIFSIININIKANIVFIFNN